MLNPKIIPVPKLFINNLEHDSPDDVRLNKKETDVLLLDDIFAYDISAYHTIHLSKYFTVFIFNKGGQKETILEFKPKWLYTPPASFKTCRNCVQGQLKKQKFSNCTLLLLSMPAGVQKWCNNIQIELENRGFNINVYNGLFRVILEHYNIITTLYKLQNKSCNNIHQVLQSLSSEEDATDAICCSMSLRDVSMVINLSLNKVQILDVDPKPNSKWKKWKEQEIKNSSLYFRKSDCSLDFCRRHG